MEIQTALTINEPNPIPQHGLHIQYSEGAVVDDAVARLYRNGIYIGNIHPVGPSNERKFITQVCSIPCCLHCQIDALLTDFDRRNPPEPTIV